MQLKKQQLEVEEDLAFLVFGLVSGHKANKLVYFINQIVSFDFARIEDFKLPDYNPKSESGFSKFTYHDEENHLDFFLIANKEFGLILFNELKQFDFLVIVRGGIDFFQSSEFARSCMELPGINLVAPIHNNKVKSKISWVI